MDWIGLSAYSRNSISEINRSFSHLASYTYHNMKEYSKPIMMSEIGKTKDSSQRNWFENAYTRIKSWSSMKAVVCWDNVNYELDDDHTLTKESRQFFRELFQDPYFITAVK